MGSMDFLSLAGDRRIRPGARDKTGQWGVVVVLQRYGRHRLACCRQCHCRVSGRFLLNCPAVAVLDSSPPAKQSIPSAKVFILRHKREMHAR